MFFKDAVGHEIDSLDAKLDQSAELQNKFDYYAFNWSGEKKAAALKEANAEILLRHSEGGSGKIREVFQHEKFSQLTRKWCVETLKFSLQTTHL